MIEVIALVLALSVLASTSTRIVQALSARKDD